MLNYKEKIIDALWMPYCHFISDINKATNISKEKIKSTLKELEQENLIHVIDGMYFIKKQGIIEIKSKGFGFIRVDGEDEEYYVASNDTKGAYTKDLVEFYVLPKGRGQNLNNGVVISILNPSNEFIYGKLITKKSKRGTEYQIVSYNKDFDIRAVVEEANLNGAIDGNIVVGKLVDPSAKVVYATIDRIVGHKDDPGVDISLIALEYGFETEFPDKAIAQSFDIPNEVDIDKYQDRRDFSNDLVITIDGDTSKDFDDAVSVKRLENGNYELSVHIADVSEYVKEEDPLDREAYKRGTSVYLADRVIPMLPHKLSNGICSLNEGVYRLVLSCIMEIDTTGNVVNYEICEGIIKSAHRMTYNKINKMLAGDRDLIDTYYDIYPMVLNMKDLSDIIRAKRTNDGSLDFDVPEYGVSLDEQGKPIDFILRERGAGELLIEDFMLMANQTVAYHMNIMKLPCVYRVHEEPDQAKLSNVFGFIQRLGYKVKSSKNGIRPKMIQDAMNLVKDSPEEYVINQMMLRAMMKAKYSEECLGHYGLAFPYYCHFTSPIRRYPDLMTHRLIKTLLLHPGDDFDDNIQYYNYNLPDICENTSIQERKSVDCEREVNDMLMAEYMSKHIGEAYSGVISSITSFGMFVTLPNGVEGLVHISNMKGYFIYNEKNMSLNGYGVSYNIGDKVDIVVFSTSKKDRSVDFILHKDFISKEWY